MSAIIALVAHFWRPIAALFAGAAAYLKGRSDANRNAQMKDTRDANEIRRKGSAARDAASRDGVHDDGWRRD